jgi:hypothetical protein
MVTLNTLVLVMMLVLSGRIEFFSFWCYQIFRNIELTLFVTEVIKTCFIFVFFIILPFCIVFRVDV